MRSQCGPLASATFTAVSINRMTRIEAQPFRLLLLRRLRLLPLTSRTCRCGRQHDSFGHHRAACSVVGVLGGRGFPLEQAAAQVCTTLVSPLHRDGTARRTAADRDGAALLQARRTKETTGQSKRQDGTPDPPEPCQSGVAPEMERRVGLQRGQGSRVVPLTQANKPRDWGRRTPNA